MSNILEDELPPSDIRSSKKPRAPKSGTARPSGSPELALVQVRLSQILQLDPDIAEFFRQQDFSFENVIDFKVWSKESARWSYQIAPMILIQRAKGYSVLGSGRAWRVAQSVFEPNDLVPALLLTDIKRISTEVKFQIVAAELFGLCADFRTRPHLPAKLLGLWKQMKIKGINCIDGDDSKAFSRATGYSLRALKPASKSDLAPVDASQSIDDPASAQPFASGSDT